MTFCRCALLSEGTSPAWLGTTGGVVLAGKVTVVLSQAQEGKWKQYLKSRI